MRLRKIMLVNRQNKSFHILLLLFIFIFPLCSYGTTRFADGTDGQKSEDTIRQVCFDEMRFIIDRIENTYISGRRGLDDEEWNRRVATVYDKLQNFFDNGMNGYYVYVWRYLNLLKSDAHFRFPDDGMFNRWGYFKETDNIFPLWVQTWKDGSVYNVKDYRGIIPQYAQIISINGHSAKELALANRAIAPGEKANSMAMMNAKYETDPVYWPNFANFLFMEGIGSPFQVVYSLPNSSRPDTVILRTITRAEKSKLFKKSGDEDRIKPELGLNRKPIEYKNAGNGIGVLSINSFWGGRMIPMLLFGKDWRYKRLLRRAMRRIDRDNIKNLVIDVSLNSGGMTENVYYTLNYFTDEPIDMNAVYRITDESRERLQTNISRSPHIAKDDRKYLAEYIGGIKSGTVFCTDTVCDLKYRPDHPKHGFRGNVYVLTGPITYSAGQMFARYCQTLKIGITAGQHCGGYTEISTGNNAKITLPQLSKLEFEIPFGITRICKEDAPYDYPPVDLPIDHPFDEWLKRENNTLNRLIDMIRSRAMQNQILHSENQ